MSWPHEPPPTCQSCGCKCHTVAYWEGNDHPKFPTRQWAYVCRDPECEEIALTMLGITAIGRTG